jgi:hypothetical protein
MPSPPDFEPGGGPKPGPCLCDLSPWNFFHPKTSLVPTSLILTLMAPASRLTHILPKHDSPYLLLAGGYTSDPVWRKGMSRS